jgi:hypothetical protein
VKRHAARCVSRRAFRASGAARADVDLGSLPEEFKGLPKRDLAVSMPYVPLETSS